jgi:hypothetical protein
MGIFRCCGLVTNRNYGDMSTDQLRTAIARELGTVLKNDMCPVWVSEFGADLANPEEMRWLKEFAAIIEDHKADWAYWPLNVGPKPGYGSDEIYGMLDSETWMPKLEADRRLELLGKIGLQRLPGVPAPEPAESPTKYARSSSFMARTRRSLLGNRNPLSGLMTIPSRQDLSCMVHELPKWNENPTFRTRPLSTPDRMYMLAGDPFLTRVPLRQVSSAGDACLEEFESQAVQGVPGPLLRAASG